jgi:hypothetical protein
MEVSGNTSCLQGLPSLRCVAEICGLQSLHDRVIITSSSTLGRRQETDIGVAHRQDAGIHRGARLLVK